MSYYVLNNYALNGIIATNPNAVIVTADADDKDVCYKLRQLKDYSRATEYISSFNTVNSLRPYIFVLNAMSEVCKRKDYYNIREDLRKLLPYLHNDHVLCVLVCDETSPLHGVWDVNT